MPHYANNGEGGKTDITYSAELEKFISDLCGTDEWKLFVKNILMPTIEAVSENPQEGAAIVLSKSFSTVESYISEMPKSDKYNIDPAPTDITKYADKDSFRRHIVQDGATVVSYDDEKINPRIQLKGKLGKDETLKNLLANCSILEDKVPIWGTRHISCLHFICEIKDKEQEKIVFCIVISQDGEVHFMNSKPQDNIICKRVLFS